MKTLYLLRHAKADCSPLILNDFDRPLDPQGLEDATKMAQVFAEKLQHNIDVIITSPAKRAVTTALLFAKALELNEDKVIRKAELYGADLQGLLATLHRFDDRHEHILFINHNPSISELNNFLSDERMTSLPTCGLVALTFQECSWGTVNFHSAKQLFFICPDKMSD